MRQLGWIVGVVVAEEVGVVIGVVAVGVVGLSVV